METTAGGVRPIVVREFVVAISNPKALLLFVALLPHFTGSAPDGAGMRIAVLGVAYLAVELLVGFVYIAVGTRLGAAGIPAHTQHRVGLGVGVVLLGRAVLLAVDGLS